MNVPISDICELSIFGTGFGESILIHIGKNEWIVIDSCYDDQEQPAILNYLKQLDVPPAQIKYIVATHWHTDHIKGLSEIYQQAENAVFVFSAALENQQFLELIHGFSHVPGILESSTSEFLKILQLFDQRKKQIKAHHKLILASDFKLILNDTITDNNQSINRTILALSPSSSAQINSLRNIAKLIPQENRPLYKPPALRPNHTSIVLYIEIGDLRLLLGSDLEELTDKEDGWQAIVNDHRMQKNESEIFKVPHHGSKNAHNEQVWLDHVTEDNTSLLTSFCHGKTNLPSEDDLNRISKFSSKIYIAGASKLINRKLTREEKSLLRKQNKLNHFHSIKRELGSITIQKPFINGNHWSVQCIGATSKYQSSPSNST